MLNTYTKIKRDAFASFLDTLIKQYTVLAPVMCDGICRFEQITAGSQAEPRSWLTKIPLKELFLPQTECLYRYERRPDGGLSIQTPLNNDNLRVVFGVRPCDARSLSLFDRVFLETDKPDPYYSERRTNTILIGIGCAEPRSVCFCTSVGGSPLGEENLDILFLEVGDEFLIKALSPKGNALISFMSAGAANEIEPLMVSARINAEETMGDRVPITGLKDKLDCGFDAPVWNKLHEPCIECGVCAFLCPTCYCFDLNHETDGKLTSNGAGQCVRSWDTCMFSLFTRQASGVNPRPGGKERMRQRIMHKFKYFVDNYQEMACVGCGRCIINCPAACDIRESIAQIQKITSDISSREGVSVSCL